MRRTWYLGCSSIMAAVALALSLLTPAWAPPLTIFSANCATAVTIVTTTETVLCTVTGTTGGPGQIIRLWGVTQVTVGTGGTALTFRWRRGSTTAGTQIGLATAINATAAATVQVAHAAEDTGVELAAQPYVLTVAQTAATANGTGVYSELLMLIL